MRKPHLKPSYLCSAGSLYVLVEGDRVVIVYPPRWWRSAFRAAIEEGER
jgi:hypothetical protein